MIIEHYRQAKCHGDYKEYRLLNTSIQQSYCRDREACLNQFCSEIQEYVDHNVISAVYKKICQIARDFKPRTREIKKDDSALM